MNFKSLYKTLLLLALVPGTILLNAASVDILFGASSIKIAGVKTLEDKNLKSCQNDAHPVLALFYQYYFPTGLEAYKALFQHNNYPVGIEQSYPEWRAYMSNVSIELESIYSALYENQTTAIVTYRFIKGGTTARLSFFAKQIEGHWYPFEAGKLLDMQDLRAFFPILNPVVMRGLLHQTVEPEISELSTEITHSCADNAGKFSAECLYATAETWGISEDASIAGKSKILFQDRVIKSNQIMEPLSAESVNPVFDTLQIPTAERARIMYYLRRGETMIAYHKIQAFVPGLQYAELNALMAPLLGTRALQVQNIEQQ